MTVHDSLCQPDRNCKPFSDCFIKSFLPINWNQLLVIVFAEAYSIYQFLSSTLKTSQLAVAVKLIMIICKSGLLINKIRFWQTFRLLDISFG